MPEGLFQCTFEMLDGIMCLALSGDLDLATVATFRAHLALAARGTDGLLLDFRNLRYIDSSGIHALMDTYYASGRLNRRIALVGASESARRVLSVFDLELLMPVFASVDEALEYLRPISDSKSA